MCKIDLFVDSDTLISLWRIILMISKYIFSAVILAASFNVHSGPLDTIKSTISNSINQAYQQIIAPAINAVVQTTTGGHAIGALLASCCLVTGKYPFSNCKLPRVASVGLLATHGCAAALSLIADGQWTTQDEVMHAERSYNLVNENKQI